MQRKILNKFVTRESKLAVLYQSWEQTFCYMLERNKVIKDVKLSRFIYMVNKHVLPDVKDRILGLYLEKCKLIGCIAFSQWRYIQSIINPNKFKKINLDQLEEQIKNLHRKTKGMLNTDY